MEELDSEAIGLQFRATMRKYPAAVTIITANDGIRDHGMTATAVTSVSMDPPSMMACLNNRTLLHTMLLNQPYFAVNVLSVSHPEVSEAFSGKVAPEERFSTGGWVRDPKNMLILPTAHATVICSRVAAVPFGTHTIFVGRVLRAHVDEETRPLLYQDAAYHTSLPAL
ncbi:flavin reductase family protein [Martelella soudanensis]|uniref:flavin reductase family protein n=1 Tax=unclassified Martelella TaxID=2629616 RepID=UPI0015DDB7C2|nr:MULTISPECIES: flavin reductase family protein [unclassified Martelella]